MEIQVWLRGQHKVHVGILRPTTNLKSGRTLEKNWE